MSTRVPMVATPCLLASTAALPVRNSMAPQPRRQFACVRLRQDELFAFASSAEKGPGFGAPRAVGGWRTKESAESSFAMFAACVTVGRQTLHSKASLGRMTLSAGVSMQARALSTVARCCHPKTLVQNCQVGSVGYDLCRIAASSREPADRDETAGCSFVAPLIRKSSSAALCSKRLPPHGTPVRSGPQPNTARRNERLGAQPHGA